LSSAKINKTFGLTDIISISDFSKHDIEFILSEAARMERMPPEKKMKLLRGKTVASLFFEPSTRTRLSFEAAIQNLGASVIGFAGEKGSSAEKGETLSDTIRVVSSYADMIVMRHHIEGSARRAAEISPKSVVNAGDGSNQHPTQTLLDLYTIKKEFGKIDGLSIGMVGDLRYGRAVHSLAYALANFRGVNLYLASPPSLRMPRQITDGIGNRVRIKEGANAETFMPHLDLLYATRIQKERFAEPLEYEKVKNAYVVDSAMLKNAKRRFRIMHPLPRVGEIDAGIDSTKAALYFKQAANGIPVREAVLRILSRVKK
jgi:aspartate carbamoyltransferase catalytic subunit